MTTTQLPRSTDEPPPLRNSVPTRRTLVIAGVAVVAIAIAVWLIAFSSVLGVKSITVRGATTVSLDTVRSAAQIKSGTPLIRLDSAAIVHRIERLPTVASASVRAAYPNTVVITVVERVAVGYVENGTQYTLVDRTGDQFRTVSARPRALPLFVVPTGPQAQATGGALATVAASLPAALRAKVASIQAFDPTAITLSLLDHRVVSWGSADRSAEKARILPTLLTQQGTQFDVTDPTQVFVH
jgi:cell division protein FtsQ